VVTERATVQISDGNRFATINVACVRVRNVKEQTTERNSERRVGTVKILAIFDMVPNADANRIKSELVAETKAVWSLFEADFVREAYLTGVPGRVVLALEADNADGAAGRLRDLPFVAQGLVQFELIELHPFLSWSRLFAS
jgi:hypothetical protein